MILAHGRLYDSSEQETILQSLEEEINHTRAVQRLDPDTVIRAVDRLAQEVRAGRYDARIASLEVEGADRYKELAISMMSQESLRYQLRTELGDLSWSEPIRLTPPDGLPGIESRVLPLGTLFHIAAGNVDGLPAFSVAEGLLTGNINILKLPQADNGFSIDILRDLTEIEPRLAEFIYVFDTPSSDLPAMKRLADLADGIVVWGGEAAVAAVRRLAPSGVKLIEWGHRLGFVYVSGLADPDRELRGLAEHIVSTRQLLCSSCQTIFVDTASMEEIRAFCRMFLPYLEQAMDSRSPSTLGGMAEMSLRRYNDKIEAAIRTGCVPRTDEFRGDGCSLIACEDQALELSPLFGNCLVKRLPREDMMRVLRWKKGCLQTAGLICRPADRADLTDRLLRCGVNRVMTPAHMSHTFSGEAHDGEYPLRRYVRMVHVE